MSEDVVPGGLRSDDKGAGRAEPGSSLHYVDDVGSPVDVRRLYRSWVAALVVVAAFAGYAAWADRHRRVFSLGAWEGGFAVALMVAAG